MLPKSYTRYHQTVTVHAHDQARYNGQRCYRTDLSGAIPMFFGASAILAFAPVDERITRYWYIPANYGSDYDFDRDFAAVLDRLGDWPTTDDAA